MTSLKTTVQSAPAAAAKPNAIAPIWRRFDRMVSFLRVTRLPFRNEPRFLNKKSNKCGRRGQGYFYADLGP
jgi:hypothetical protein